MSDPTVAAVAKKHNVSSAQVMYRFVSAHGISVLSSFGTEEHAVEDMGIFDINLDEEDMANLRSLQKGKRTCQDCWTQECQACAAKLIQNGCPVGKMPAWGRDNPDSAKCMACASAHNTTISEVCGPEYMLVKACGTAGGFPHSVHEMTEIVV